MLLLQLCLLIMALAATASGRLFGGGSSIMTAAGVKSMLSMGAFPWSDSSGKEDTYDYIIVGGGTAGCVLANRLSSAEGGSKRVLVLEAGSDDFTNKMVRVPAGVLKLFKNPAFDWDFESEKQSSTAGRGVYLCRGKVLGGSSCTNVLLYHRGNRADYDFWAAATNDATWGADSVLELFKKSEHNTLGAAHSSVYHGTGGEYAVSEVRYQNPLARMFLTAAEQMGGVANDDFNNWGRSQEGFGRYQVNERDGERCSAASGFLSPVLHRKNLTVKSRVLVSKIMLSGKCTVGVETSCQGSTDVHKLKKGGEVLLCGGAIASPQLLMLSGIGSETELARHGIPCVHDLPGVGQNLQDHPAAIVSYKCSPGNEGISVTSQIRIKGTTWTRPAVILQWLLRKTGPLTSTGCDHGAFLKTSPELESSDLQLRFLAAQALTADGMGTYTRFRESAKLGDGFSVQSIAVRPHSRGSVCLRSSNPRDKPVIHGGYVSDEAGKDIATLREGLRKSRQIVASAAFDSVRGEEVFPGSSVQSDEDLDAYIRDSLHTSNALTGTCKMGNAEDSSAVVDPCLRVRGIEGLRVVDASVMPKIPGGQTGAPTVMIAEKAAIMLTK